MPQTNKQTNKQAKEKQLDTKTEEKKTNIRTLLVSFSGRMTINSRQKTHLAH